MTANTHLTSKPYRRASCAVATIAAVAALAACGTENEDATPDAAGEEQSQSAESGGDSGENPTPDVPLEDLVLTGDEVPGTTLEPLDPEGRFQDMFAQLPDSVQVEPESCRSAIDTSQALSNLPTTHVGTFDDEPKLLGVSLSDDTSIMNEVAGFGSSCPEYTLTMDVSELVKQQSEQSAGQEIPPEVEEMFGDDFGKATQEMKLTELDVEAPEGVDEFFAFAIEGTETAMGQSFPSAKVQLTGVVDGILVTTSGAPGMALDPQSGQPLTDASVIDMESYQAKADEAFRAQVEKIRNA